MSDETTPSVSHECSGSPCDTCGRTLCLTCGNRVWPLQHRTETGHWNPAESQHSEEP